MKRRRTDEEQRTYFRSGRFFRVDDGAWYFATREGCDMGPYPTLQAAEWALGDYIRRMTGEEHLPTHPWDYPGADR